jgi:hypothetical protein
MQVISFGCDGASPAGIKRGIPSLAPLPSQQTLDMTTYNILPENIYNWLINLNADTSKGVDPLDLMNNPDKDLVPPLIYPV